jgi:serine protease
MKFIVLGLSLLSIISADDDLSPQKIPGCYIVSFKGNPGGAKGLGAKALFEQNKVKTFAKSFGKISKEYKSFNGFTVCGIKSESQMMAFKNNSEVAFIEQDQMAYPDALRTVNNPLSWGLDRIDQRSSTLDMKYAYEDTVAPVNVYVIDSGILTSHVQFGGRAIHGYNFVNSNSDSTDCNGHGTHCAGTIGGLDYGVCKHCKLIGVKVFGCTGGSPWSTVLAGIDWATNQAVASGIPSVISMSLGGSLIQTINTAVENAVSAGVVVVVAAGNSNSDACQFSPASAPSAITVGATTILGQRASYSNYGPCIDIFAPGSDIASASISSNTAARNLSGTSMATPHVAGVAALYRSYFPSKSVAEVRNFIVHEVATRNAITGLSTLPLATSNRLLYYQPANQISGNIDGFVSTPSGGVLSGWTCNSQVFKSLEVHIYAGGAFGVGSFLKSAIAQVASEPAISTACGTTGVSHRFSIPFSFAELDALNGRKLFVHAISVFPGRNSLLPKSGVFPDFSVKGNIDGFFPSASGGSLMGWTCNSRIAKSIAVHVYYGGAFGQGTFLKSGIANLASEPAVSSACGTSGVQHRFSIPISSAELALLNGSKFFVHGISQVTGWGNPLIGGSGIFPSP